MLSLTALSSTEKVVRLWHATVVVGDRIGGADDNVCACTGTNNCHDTQRLKQSHAVRTRRSAHASIPYVHVLLLENTIHNTSHALIPAAHSSYPKSLPQN